VQLLVWSVLAFARARHVDVRTFDADARSVHEADVHLSCIGRSADDDDPSVGDAGRSVQLSTRSVCVCGRHVRDAARYAGAGD
jgi:hypothetical protein